MPRVYGIEGFCICETFIASASGRRRSHDHGLGGTLRFIVWCRPGFVAILFDY